MSRDASKAGWFTSLLPIWGLPVGGIWYAGLIFLGDTKKFDDLAVAMLTVSSIAVGFIATAKSIIISSRDTRPVKLLAEGGQLTTLYSYLLHSLQWSLVLTVVCAALIVVDFDTVASWHKFVILPWLLLVGWTLGSVVRSVFYFGRVVSE